MFNLLAQFQAKIALEIFKHRARRFNSSWQKLNEKLKNANVPRTTRRQMVREIIKGHLPDYLEKE